MVKEIVKGVRMFTGDRFNLAEYRRTAAGVPVDELMFATLHWPDGSPIAVAVSRAAQLISVPMVTTTAVAEVTPIVTAELTVTIG